MHLFVDTTQKITLGLLDKDFDWVDFFFDPKIVVSTKLHSLIQQMLTKQGLEFSDLSSLIYIAGPGSYTGMRVAEGIAQIVEWQKKDVYSFYHYEIPKICGIKSGSWVANAFKGEIFIHKWDEMKHSNQLVLEKDYKDRVSDQNVYSHFENLNNNTTSTAELLASNSKKIFKYVLENKLKRDLYYYRSIEQEFSKC